MIAGTTVGSLGGFNDGVNIALRVIGPSLTRFGLTNVLQDPILELYDVNGARIGSNDNWRTSQEQQIQAAGLSPGDDREAAILVRLTPGNYTAIVRGKNSGTGNALVQLFNLD
jgi:hypothetical protein